MFRSIVIASFSAIACCVSNCAAEEASLRLVGREGKAISLTASDLKALPRTEIDVKERDGTTAKVAGVEVLHLLEKVDTAQGDQLRGDWLRAFVTVDAADGYRAVFALPEFDPAYTDQKIILVDSRNGEPLNEKQGPFQIVIPDEKRRSRWVRMVAEIRVHDSGAPSSAAK